MLKFKNFVDSFIIYYKIKKKKLKKIPEFLIEKFFLRISGNSGISRISSGISGISGAKPRVSTKKWSYIKVKAFLRFQFLMFICQLESVDLRSGFRFPLTQITRD